MKKLSVALVFILLIAIISVALESKPIANFTYEIDGYVAHFNATSSYDEDGFIINYTWNFGDGKVGYGVVVDHSYIDEGFYNVSLTVLDNSGLNNSTWQIICIDVSPPYTVFKTIPSIPNGENGWFVSNVNVTLIAHDNLSGVKETYYKINNENWIKFSGNFTINEGVHEINYYSKDNAGNEENIKSREIKIDTTPPYTLCFLSANATNGWYNEELNVSLESYDNLSGVDKTYYRIDGDDYKIYNKSFVISEGKHVLEYFAIDIAGNACPLQRKEINIDMSSPTISLAAPYHGIYLFGRKIYTSAQTIVIGGITIEAYGFDNLSGVKEMKLYIDGEYKTNSSKSTIEYEWDEFAIGYHEIKVIVYDRAGNYKEMKEDVFIINLKWS